MPSIDEMNAVYDVAEDYAHKLIEHFVPSLFKGRVVAHLESPQGRDLMLDGIRQCLVAAEQVRAKAGGK
jgi:hypothetical protein